MIRRPVFSFDDEASIEDTPTGSVIVVDNDGRGFPKSLVVLEADDSLYPLDSTWDGAFKFVIADGDAEPVGDMIDGDILIIYTP